MATVIVPQGTTDLTTLGIATGDSVLFNEGGQNVTTLFAGGVSNLASVYVGKFANVTVGNATTGPVTTPINTLLSLNGSGGSWMQSGNTTRIKLLSNQNLSLTGGTHASVEASNGSVTIAAGAIATQLVSSGATVFADYITSADGFQHCRISGGVATLGRGTDSNHSGSTIEITGGAVDTMKRTTTVAGSIPTITGSGNSGMCRVFGAKLIYQGGNIDTLIGLNSVIDLSGVPASLTITNLIIDRPTYERSVFKSNANPLATVTVTNVTILGAETDTLVL